MNREPSTGISKKSQKTGSPARGIVFDIKRYAIHDGPGIRTTVFLKGCPLSCWWCHNPEGIDPAVETVSAGNRGRGDNRTVIGAEKTDSQVLSEIDKECLFYDQSGGGATFSGGEPLMQPEFLRSMLRGCRERGIHTALDTSGYAETGVLASIAPLVDLFLYDLKFVDDGLHRRYTGVENGVILENLKWLDRQEVPYLIRFPVIPTITDTGANIDAIADLLRSLRRMDRIELLAYHTYAAAKYKRLKIKNLMAGRLERAASGRSLTVDKLISESLDRVRARFQSRGLAVASGG